MGNRRVKKLRKEVNEELGRMYRERGVLRASDVVDEARPASSPLHAHFEWDDTKAGHAYRLQQARTLIRVCVVSVGDDDKQKSEPYVWVPPITDASDAQHGGKEGEYHPASVVVQNPDWFSRAYIAATAKLDGAKRAIEDLKRAAESESEHSDKLPLIRIALEALATADSAVRQIH